MSGKHDALIATLEILIDVASRPLSNDLEVGFRHHPLSDKEKLERYRENFEFVHRQLSWVLEQMS